MHEQLRAQGKSLIFLAGDSSLDNKFWLQFCPPPRRARALNGYERALRPGDLMHRDVCYWLNRAALDSGLDVVCVNAAVEASTLGERSGACGGPRLLPQDRFVAEHLLPDDVLCVSVGGNDIAMRPTFATVCSILALIHASPEKVKSGRAWGLQHFVRLFRDDLRRYVEHVLGERQHVPGDLILFLLLLGLWCFFLLFLFFGVGTLGGNYIGPV